MYLENAEMNGHSLGASEPFSESEHMEINRLYFICPRELTPFEKYRGFVSRAKGGMPL